MSEELNEPFTFSARNALAFRFYADNRPKNMEIAPLQKGLILMLNDVELVEEGAGFGVPIAKYADQTFFSSTAQTHLIQHHEKCVIFTKIFLLDTISEKQIRGAAINGNLYSFFHKPFEKGYLNRQDLRPVFDSLMKIRKILGVKTHSLKCPQKAKSQSPITVFLILSRYL